MGRIILPRDTIIPPNGTDLELFQDSDGAVKLVASDGTKSTLASTSAATPSAPGLMSAAQAAGLQGGGVPGAFWASAVIDLTAAPATYQVISACPYRLFRSLGFWEIKSTSGASVGPTWSGGSDAGVSNLLPSQTTAALASQAAETLVAVTSVNPVIFADLTANGLSVKITNAATATGLTARFIMFGALVPV